MGVNGRAFLNMTEQKHSSYNMKGGTASKYRRIRNDK